MMREDLKLNEIVRRLNLTPTEGFRQLQKLTEAALLEKLPEAKYRLTEYGKLVLDSSSSLSFLSKNREYFLDHNASLLPPEFRGRFGELSAAILSPDVVTSLNKITDMVRSARDRIDVMVDARFGLQAEMMIQRQLEGVKFRRLMQESMIPEAKTLLSSEKHLPEMRVIPTVCAGMIMTEKEAGFALRRLDGKIDQIGFYGNDDSSLRWSGDLFSDQWEKAKPWYP
jgi:predicted transcriptional regulator